MTMRRRRRLANRRAVSNWRLAWGLIRQWKAQTNAWLQERARDGQ